MTKTTKTYRAGRGFTIIELMVAMTLGLILLGGTINLFISNKRTYQEQNFLAALQENGRFAIDILSRDLRMAGFFGCNHKPAEVHNYLLKGAPEKPVDPDDDPPADMEANDDFEPGSLYDSSNGIEASEAAGNWQPSDNEAVKADMIANTDAVTVRFLSGESFDVVADMDPTDGDPGEGLMTDVGDRAIVSTAADHPSAGDRANNFRTGEVLGISDCNKADIFQLSTLAVSKDECDSQPPCDPNGRVRHEDANTWPGDQISPGNTWGKFSQVYAAGTKVRRYMARRYYIAESENSDDNSLWRQSFSVDFETNELSEQSEELIEGVESMQILYGLDDGEDGVPDNYYKADDAAMAGNWGNVVSVRLALLMYTPEYGTDTDGNTYTLLDNAVYAAGAEPNDRRRRRIFTTTIQLRNRINRST